MRGAWRHVPVFLLLLVGAVPPVALAQEPQGAQGSFSDTLDVQAVDVEVVVTDRKGKPVQGLKAADFRLLVDGKPVPAEFFAEIREGGVVAAAEPAAEGGAAVPVPLQLQESDTVANNYLVFIDDYFTAPVMRNRALAGLAREVATMRPQDRMAVVSYDNRKLRVLAPWTAPGDNLRKLLEQLATRKAKLEVTPFSIADLEPAAGALIERYSNSVDGAGGATGSMVSREDTAALENRMIEGAIAAAAATLRSFAAVPGRKLLVLLSGGWNHERGLGRKTVDREERLMPLIDTCNLLGYTAYPVHLVESGPASLPAAGSGAVSASAGIGPTQGFTGTPQQKGLVVTAEETGGRFLVPGGNHRHLSRIAADTRSYYWLGFTYSGEQRRRSIQVEVVRPGLPKLEVRSRKGFVPLSRRARLDLEAERALLVQDHGGSAALGVSVGKLRKVGRDTGELPVTVLVPAEQLELVRQGDRYTARLELRIAALDESGARSDIPVIPFEVTRDQPAAPGSHIRYETRLQVRYVPQDLQFLLYDTVSGKSFAERVRVQP